MRIYKGSEITLKLYTRINCQSIEADKMRVVLFTTNPNNSYMVNNVVVSGDTLLVTVGRNDLNTMEDGVINYIILGYDDNEEIYNSTRQSNYYLKTPDGYVAKSVQTSKDVYIVDNGDYKILPDEDYTSIEEVNVHVDVDTDIFYNSGYTDGFNIGYDEGIEYASENAGDVAAQTARVLDITENGSYLSQYSEPVYPDTITGVYPDGTNFYDYAKLESIELEGIKYDTELIPTLNTKVEFWFKPTSHPDNSDRMILGVQTGAEGKSVFKAFINSRFVLGTEIGGTGVQCQLDENWHHIEMSFADGLWVDGEKIGDYTANISGTFNLSFGINYLNDVGLTKYNLNNGNNSTFGMIKITIDDVENVIIPTAEGFKNITTNKLLKKASPYKDTEEVYDYTETTLTDSNPVTGVYDDGTEFYSYTSLNGKVFDTGIPVAEDSKIDFWWNDNLELYDTNYSVNVGAQETSDFVFKICKMSNGNLNYEYGYRRPQSGSFQITKGEWHHFVMSKQEGLFVDDVLVTTINNDFQTDNYPTFHINASYDNEITYNANGLYGMIKITSNGVENIIIPTADGFKNITTDEMLTIKREGTYQYTNITSSGKEDIQTGDGDFYSSVKLNNMCFDTGIDATRDTRIEFWYKPIFKNMFEHYYYYGILSNNNSKPLSSTDREFGIMGNYSDNSFYAKLGYMYKNIILNDWNHIIMSGDEGVIVNGTKVGGLMKLDPFNLRLYINCNGDKAIATGYYGMIKINDTIIIPTPNGFLNTNTGEYLTQVPYNKYLLGYNFTEQKIIYPEGNLIKEVHVNVQPKIDVGNDLKFYFSRFYIVPDYFDFSNTTDGDQLFQNSWLQKIPESLDTSKLTTAANTFSSTSVPDEDFYNLNFENCFNFSEPFGSRGIKDYSFLTNWNMPSIASQNQIVKNGDVEYIPALYNTGRNGGYYASSIIQSYSDLTKLTYFGGYIGRTESMESNYALNKCPNLSYESCKSILENLYDFTGNGEVPNSSQGKLKVHSNFLTTIGDEISIATDKGWNVYS